MDIKDVIVAKMVGKNIKKEKVMGFFSKLGDLGRNGAPERIECLTCGDHYRGNIDRNFPYAICGRCLEQREIMQKEMEIIQPINKFN